MRSSHQTSVKVRSVPCHCIGTHASDALRRPLTHVPIATARAARHLTLSSEDKLSLGWQWDVTHVLWAD